MRVLSIFLLLLLSFNTYADNRVRAEGFIHPDPRVCNNGGSEIERTSSGRIKRNISLLREFQSIWPCPSTGSKEGSCPGWFRDHTVPLACGGCDSIINLTWLPYEIKSAAGQFPKDRWELKYYCKKEIIKWEN